MKQIIKIESNVTIFFKESWGKTQKFLKNKVDIIVDDVSLLNDYAICKQISYQYFDFEKNKWVVLPTPKQPKIKIEGAYTDEKNS